MTLLEYISQNLPENLKTDKRVFRIESPIDDIVRISYKNSTNNDVRSIIINGTGICWTATEAGIKILSDSSNIDTCVSKLINFISSL